MTDIMNELRTQFASARMYLDFLQEKLENGTEQPADVRATLVRVIGALASYGRPPVKAGRQPRGVGYDLDEAMIMASVDEYGGSIERAARAHWHSDTEDMVDAKLRRLYRHKKEIEDLGAEFP
jgi:hypothetical protein